MTESLACLTPDCQRVAVRRGCCLACAERHYRAMRAGLESEKNLIVKGLFLPAKGRRKGGSDRWGCPH